MKPSFKALSVALIVLVGLSTIGCLFVTPATTDQPTPVPPSSNPIEAPTAASPRSMLPADGLVVSALTDANGQAVFTDPVDFQHEVTVSVQDGSTQQPVAGVNLWLKSSGQEILIVAVDPSGTYVSAVQEYNYADLTRETGGGNLAALAPAPRQVIPVVVLIALVRAAMLYEDISTYYAALSDLPGISRWSFQQNEFCMANPNKDQLDKYASAIISAIPLPDFLANKVMLRPVRELLSRFIEERLIMLTKDVVAENISAVMETAVGQAINDQPPAIIHFTIFGVTGGIPDILIPDGYCLEPLVRSDIYSVLKWTKYGTDYQNTYALASISEGADAYWGILYANQLEGGSRQTQAQFLQDVALRFPAQPTCTGFIVDQNVAYYWSDGWNPAWQLNESCYEVCNPLNPPHTSSTSAFVFKKLDNLWELQGVYMQPPDVLVSAYNYTLQSCNQIP